MSYQEELAKVHAECIKDGVSRQTLRAWDCQAICVIQKAGFRTPEQVRRAADTFGRRIG